MSDYKFKKIEDLVTTIILNNEKIEKVGNVHTIHFNLNDNKSFILKKYIQRLNLKEDFLKIKKVKSNNYILESNLTVERVIRKLFPKDRSFPLDNSLININIIMLMLSLFSETGYEGVIIKTKLPEEMKNYLAAYSNLLADVNLEPSKDYFIVNNLINCINLSIKIDRPYYETIELVTLLNFKDYQKLFKKRRQIMKEHSTYDYATN